MEKDRYPLLSQCLAADGIPEPVRGFKIIVPEWLKYYRFSLPKNHWRIDYVWPHELLAVQIDGGAWGGGGHTRGNAFRRDMIQHNLLVSYGFTLYVFMPEMLPHRSAYAIDTIKNFFALRAGKRE